MELCTRSYDNPQNVTNGVNDNHMINVCFWINVGIIKDTYKSGN